MQENTAVALRILPDLLSCVPPLFLKLPSDLEVQKPSDFPLFPQVTPSASPLTTTDTVKFIPLNRNAAK
jgi:hypothetical protein